MEQFATEEQQVEAIKQFWKDHGTSIIVGAVLGLGGLVGWRYYSDMKIEQKETASIAYQAAVESIDDSGNLAELEVFIDDNKGNSGYADIAALVAAQQAVSSDDLVSAEKHLNTAIANTGDEHLASVARTRLARVQLAQEKYDAALTTLAGVTEDAFVAQVEEIKGDIYVAQQKFDQARLAYSTALEKAGGNRLLEMKLDNLSVTAGS